jgi:hypothetical protein
MKHRGGLPPSLRNKPPRPSAQYKNPAPEDLKKWLDLRPLPPREAQTARSGISQLLKRSDSPFTGPGPSTAGRRRKTRKIKRRS